jgi:hypothetical protein
VGGGGSCCHTHGSSLRELSTTSAHSARSSTRVGRGHALQSRVRLAADSCGPLLGSSSFESVAVCEAPPMNPHVAGQHRRCDTIK